MMTKNKIYNWLVLIYYLPPEAGSTRVRVWRKMKKLGMVSFRNSVYFLPFSEERHEIAGWLCQEIQKAGGDATLLKVESVENLTDEEVAGFFRKARDEDYAQLARTAADLYKRLAALDEARSRGGSAVGAGGMTALADELKAAEKRLAEVGEIDFFQASGRSRAEEEIGRCRLALGRLNAQEEPEPVAARPALKPDDFQERIWVTRPRPHVDRIATAWAIRRFIDPAARFEFSRSPNKTKGAVPFDFVGVELSHQGEDCTLETFVKIFGLDEDVRLQALAEIIHDADLKDGKFSRPEAAGLDAVLTGLSAPAPADPELMERGIQIIDALYAGLKTEKPKKTTRRSKNAAARGTSEDKQEKNRQ